MNRAPALLLGGAALALAGAVALSCRAPASPRHQLVLGDAALPALSLLFVAKGHGLFEAEGVTVIERRFATGREALAALEAREVDVAAALETPVAGRAFDVHDLRVLTTLHATRQGTRVVARTDRGIDGAPDLRGKRVGVPAGTNADFFLDVLLAGAGVRPDEVTRVNLPPGKAAAALERGEVDAISIWLPHGRGVPGTVELRSEAHAEMSMLVTREGVLAERPEALRRFLRALVRAEQLVEQDPQAAVDDLARELPGIPLAELREVHRRTPPQLGISNVQLRVLERAAEWQRARRGDGAPLPDLRRILAPGLLLGIEPESVTLLGVE